MKTQPPRKVRYPTLRDIIRALERTVCYSETSCWGVMSDVGIVTDLSSWSDRTTHRQYVRLWLNDRSRLLGGSIMA